MKIVPLALKQANEFVEKYHRHNKKVLVHKYSIGLEENGELVGVGIASHPVARMLNDGKTLELRRICVKEGYKNACSKLIARLKRIGQLMGYTKIITYTLEKESGVSLRAVNATPVAKVKPGSWNVPSRPAVHQPVYDEPKIRWELYNSENDKTEI